MEPKNSGKLSEDLGVVAAIVFIVFILVKLFTHLRDLFFYRNPLIGGW